jgi:hypothetical protein
MKKLMPGRPSPGMIIAVIALVFALAGGAYAADKIGISDLSKKAKNKTIGVGKLTYVTQSFNAPDQTTEETLRVSATCPSGTRPLGGGIKISGAGLEDDTWVQDGYLTTTGYAGHVEQNATEAQTVQVTVACAVSRGVTGAPPAS